MTTKQITPQQHLTVVKHLANGKGLDVVASITRLSRDQVVDIGNSHGYPDTEKLAWAVDVLTRNLEMADAAAAVSTSPTSPSGVNLVDRQPAAPHPAPVAAAPSLPSKPDEFRILINTAKGSDSKRIQSLANRILDDVAKLRGLIDAEQEKVAARQRESAQKAAARAEVERLEKQLADAKAKLRGAAPAASASATAGDGPSAKEIRAWAAEAGIDCPAVGRVPSKVTDAYDDAHRQVAS